MQATVAGMALVTALVLGGCATSREAQVRDTLVKAGLPLGFAGCMAEPLARDLSGRQLQTLARVARQLRSDGQAMGERQILETLQRDLDPEVVGVVVRAGLGCALRG